MTINVPTSWDDISVSKYVELFENNFSTKSFVTYLQSIDGNDLWLSELDTKTIDEISANLCILMDIDEADFERFDLGKVAWLMGKLTFLAEPITKTKLPQLIKKPFEELTVGEAVDLEEYAADGIEKHYFKIAQTLTGCNEDTPITQVYKTIIDYFSYRKRLFEQFSGLFTDNQVHDEDELEEEDKEDIKASSKWSWYSFIYHLAGGDFEKMHSVTERNFVGALNYFAFLKENKQTK